MTVLEHKLLTTVVTGNTADEGISSVVLGGSPDPRIQLMSLGSSDGSTLLRSCFTSDFASEKFIFTISLPLSVVLWIIWSSNMNLTSSWEVFCLLSVLWRLWMHYRHLLVRSVVQDGWGIKQKTVALRNFNTDCTRVLEQVFSILKFLSDHWSGVFPVLCWQSWLMPLLYSLPAWVTAFDLSSQYS